MVKGVTDSYCRRPALLSFSAVLEISGPSSRILLKSADKAWSWTQVLKFRPVSGFSNILGLASLERWHAEPLLFVAERLARVNDRNMPRAEWWVQILARVECWVLSSNHRAYLSPVCVVKCCCGWRSAGCILTEPRGLTVSWNGICASSKLCLPQLLG